MARRRSSPLGLELVMSTMLVFILLPLLTQAAPLQDMTEIQQYTEGCYYNYNHYNEGDRILTNEPCLNCTCHNKMLMCYLRVCPFTKPIGHDCIVEKREDQCCPIITCPEVPVDVAQHTSDLGTELSIPEKYGCSIDERFYPEGAQVPSNPNKPCELCYCIRNRTSCLMQECTLHIDGCQPIYNKGSCCPVRYNCDHENDVLELEDHSTSTTTTLRPTPGFILTTTMTPASSTDCIHNSDVYADGASLLGKNPCEHCYCMRGDIVCAVQECELAMLAGNGKSCHPLQASEGECCPSNYVCEDDTATTMEIADDTTISYTEGEVKVTTTAPIKDLHSSVSVEDLQLQKHIDDDGQLSTEAPEKIDHSRPIQEEIISSADLGVTKSPVLTNADRKRDELPATTVSDVSEADKLSFVTTSKTPSIQTDEDIPTSTSKLSDEETSSVHEKDEDTYEATTVKDSASVTVTEHPEEEIEELNNKKESQNLPKIDAEEEENTLSEHTTEKLSHSDDVSMTPDFITAQPEIVGDMEDEADVSSDKPIENEELTTDKIETEKYEEKEETIPAIGNEYSSPTTAKSTLTEDVNVTTMRTDYFESDEKFDTTSSLSIDIPQKPEKTTEHAEKLDFTTSKTDVFVDSETKVPIDENVEIVTAQPALIEDTDNAQEEEGSGSDEEDLETKTTPTVLSDETQSLDDKEEITRTTQKPPSVSDRKEDSESVTELITTKIESTTTSTSKPTEHAHKQITTIDESLKKSEDQPTSDLEVIKKNQEEQIADHTTILPEMSDDQTTTTDSDRFNVSHTPHSTEVSTAADSTKAESSQGENIDLDTDQDNDMIDETTELATENYPYSSIPSILEQHEGNKEQLAITSSADIHTSTDYPSKIDIVSSTATSTVPDRNLSDIEETTQGLILPEDVTSDIVYEMEIIPTAIPGEGNCLVGQKTYQHNSFVPTSDECNHSCRCLSSIVVCQPVQCQNPKNAIKCKLDERSTDKCCPAYICEIEASTEILVGVDSITEENEDVEQTTSHETHDSSSIEKILIPVDENDEALSSGLPTDIAIPTINTEQPMSHIKHDDVTISFTTNIPKVDDTATFAFGSPETQEPASIHDQQKPFVKPDENIDRIDATSTTPVSQETIKPHTADTVASHKPVDVSVSKAGSKVSVVPHEAYTTKPAVEEFMTQSTISPSGAADMTTISNIDDSIPENEDSMTNSTVSPVQVDSSSMTQKPDTADEEGSGYFTSTSSVENEKLDTTDKSEKHETAAPSNTYKETATSHGPSHETGDEFMPVMLPITTSSSEIETESNLSTSAPTFDSPLPVDKDEKIMTPIIETENELTDEILSHTILPLSDDKYANAPDESTLAPTVQEKTEIVDEHSPQTITPLSETDVSITPTKAPMIENEIEKIDLPHKVSPAIGTEKETPAEDSLKPTTVATIEDDSIADKLAVTTSPNEDGAMDGLLFHTIVPDLEGEEEPIDTTMSQTSVPEDHTNEPFATDNVQTITPSTEDKKTSDLGLPHILPTVEVEKSSTTENILPQTIVPSTVYKDGSEYIQKIPPRKVAPIIEDKTEHFDDAHASTPATVDKVNDSTAPEAEVLDNDLVPTSTPSDEDKAEGITDESLLQTITPTVEDDKKQSLPSLAEDKTERTVEEILTQTVASAVDSVEQQIDDEDRKDETLAYTIAPALDSDMKPIDNEDKKADTVDETLSHTVAPAVESDKKPIAYDEDKKPDTIDAALSHTVAYDVNDTMNHIDNEDKKVDESLSHTVAPNVDEDTKPIDSEDKKDDATVPHTIAPHVDENVKPNGDEDKKDDATTSHTMVPHVNEDVNPIDDEDKKLDDYFSNTVAPTVDSDIKSIDDEEKKMETPKETLSHTVAPVLDDESKTIESDKKTTNSPLEHIIVPSTGVYVEETIGESLLPTVLPADQDEKEDHKKTTHDIQIQTTTPSADDTEKENIDKAMDHATIADNEYLAHTITPTIDNKYELIDNNTANSIAPSRTDKEPVDTFLSHTIAPIVGEEKDSDEPLSHTVAPVDKNDKVTSSHDDDQLVSSGHTDVPIDIVPYITVRPINGDENYKTDEYQGPTSAPTSEETERESTVASISYSSPVAADDASDESMPQTTSSTHILNENDEEAHPSDTVSPADGDRNNIINDNVAHTIAPLAADRTAETSDESKSSTVKPFDEFSKKPTEEQTTDEFMQHTTQDAMKMDTRTELMHSTMSPLTITHTPLPVDEKEKEAIDTTLASNIPPSYEAMTEKTLGGSMAHTIAPVVEDEKDTKAGSVSHTTSPFSDVTSQENVNDSLVESVTPDEDAEKECVSPHTISSVDAEEKISNTHTTDAPLENDMKQITTTPIENTAQMSSSVEPGLSPHYDDVSNHTSASEVNDNVTVSMVAPENASEADMDVENMDQTTPSIGEDEAKTESFDSAISLTISPILENVEMETIEDSMQHTVAPTASSDKEHEAEFNITHPSIDSSVHDEDKKHMDKLPTDSELLPTDGVDHTTPLSAAQDKESQTDKTIVISTVESSTASPIPNKEETPEHTVSPQITEDFAVHDSTTVKPYNVKETDDQGTTITIPSDNEIENEPTTSVAFTADHIIKDFESMPSASTKSPLDDISETTAHGSIKDSFSTDLIPVYNEDEGHKLFDVTFTPISQDKEQITSISVDQLSAKEPDVTTAGTISARPSDETITVKPTYDESYLQTSVSPKGESITVTPPISADFGSTEETEDSVESEEEITTNPNAHRIQHIGQFVTDRGDDVTTQIPIDKIQDVKHDELETSSEEDIEEHSSSDDKDEVPSTTSTQFVAQYTSSTPMSLYDVEGDIKHESTEKPTSYAEDQDAVKITQIIPVASTSAPDALHVEIETTTIKQEKHDTSQTPVEKEDTTPHSLEGNDDKTSSIKDNITEKTESSEESDEKKESEAEVPAKTSMQPLLPHHTITTTSEPIRDIDVDVDHQPSAAANGTTVKATEKPIPTTTKTTTSASEASISTSAPSTQYSQPPPSYGGQPPQYPSYPEDEYTDEDETEVFGPGTCRYGGKLFVSAQQIPRDDPCDFCFCFRSDIICLQQSCPPPISGCHEEPISGFCCPRYECPVSMATVLNITTSTTTTSTTLPPHFLHHAYEGAAEKNGCHINGKSYRVGENIDSTSGPCMHCTCGGDGQMKCDPKTCSPEPMLRQMIAVVASRRR